MNISPEEAARALGEIEASRAAMRTTIRGFRGHYYLWLWGGIWAAMALRAEFHVLPGLRMNHWLIYPGIITTFLILLYQGTKIRSPINKRFLGVLAAIVAFSFVWPMVLGHSANGKSGFAYGVLVPMFCYIIAGIWFDCCYLLWVGLLISSLILASLFFFPAFFWWSVVLCGGALIGTGFYVRFFWH